MTNEHLLTVKKVAERLSCEEITVIRLIKNGKLEAIQLGNRYRVSEQALQKYMESAKVEVK